MSILKSKLLVYIKKSKSENLSEQDLLRQSIDDDLRKMESLVSLSETWRRDDKKAKEEVIRSRNIQKRQIELLEREQIEQAITLSLQSADNPKGAGDDNGDIKRQSEKNNVHFAYKNPALDNKVQREIDVQCVNNIQKTIFLVQFALNNIQNKNRYTREIIEREVIRFLKNPENYDFDNELRQLFLAALGKQESSPQIPQSDVKSRVEQQNNPDVNFNSEDKLKQQLMLDFIMGHSDFEKIPLDKRDDQMLSIKIEIQNYLKNPEEYDEEPGNVLNSLVHKAANWVKTKETATERLNKEDNLDNHSDDEGWNNDEGQSVEDDPWWLEESDEDKAKKQAKAKT